ncbi:cytochrome P450 [Nocardia vulneris]|uniref:Cytochrome P450 n=1 Tax=Nocardia vulneris TaxID=1141657 RepID=A0ABR4ZAX5_9NOCA|nr:cytochrome P450 [Nocardia vulneris]KIA62164.1 cytochrome P450 [Nocardia vulneris]
MLRRTTLLLATTGALWAVSRWLPRAVVALRVWIFAKVNGGNEITLPGERGGPELFRRLYEHPAANGRSRGAALSDLFWYWLAPGPEVHQEHLEDGPRYTEAARTTRAVLSLPTAEIELLAARCARRILAELPTGPVTLVRLRDLMMPIWAEFFYELVFREPCPRAARDLIVGNADDVVTSLKCTGLRHLRRRDRLTRYLLARIEAGEVPHRLPALFSPREHAYYLQGAFFNTAVVQMSEGMAHLLLAVAQHQDVQRRILAEPGSSYLEHVLDETLRQFPLFGIAHRITTDDIELGDATTIPAGTVLCFNYQQFERTGHLDPDRFDPDRWATHRAKDTHHIPFGVAANRPCPAWRLSPIAMRAVARTVLDDYRLHSSVSHTRSIPHRAPCLLLAADRPPSPIMVRAMLTGLRARDRFEDVWRGLTQLGLGTWMVLDARRQRPCARYFADLDAQEPSACPVLSGHAAD